MKKYSVILSAHGNPDHWQDPEQPLPGVPVTEAYGDTIEELQQAVRAYIEEYGLGGGNWTGGRVMEQGSHIGYISYNGRFWKVTERGVLGG